MLRFQSRIHATEDFVVHYGARAKRLLASSPLWFLRPFTIPREKSIFRRMGSTQARDRRGSGAMELSDKVGDTEIARVLAVALAIGADRGLNEKLRSLAGAAVGSAFAVSQPDDVWLTVEVDRVVAGRQRPSGVALVEKEALRANGQSIARAMTAALAQSTALADATRLIRPLLGPAEVPSRQEFAALLPWVPALEQLAYKTGASIAVTLDLLRPYIVSGLHAGEPVRPSLLRQYWQRMHAAAQFFLLASDAAAGPWLADMARQFDWANWTPTFTLLRERTTWLAACAARSAAAFGEPAVEGYLANLEACSHPFKAFDALFGLASISLGHPGLSTAIAREVRLLRRLADARGTSSSPYIRQAYVDAIDLIEGTARWMRSDTEETAALGWKERASAGLATEPALRIDPAIITQSGHLLGFLILPIVFATPVAEFNPDYRIDRRPRQSTPTDIVARVLRAAWGAPSSRTARVLH